MTRFTALALLLLAACASSDKTNTDINKELNTMARPATFPQWATSTNYAGGPDVGTPTKVAPAAGRVQDGWRNNDVPPSQQQNYEMNLIDQWIEYNDTGNTVFFADLAGLTNAIVKNKVLVYETVGSDNFPLGWYEYVATSALTADGFWIVTATGMGTGQWVHELMGSMWGRIPSIGPTPGESIYYATATPANRINRSLIPYGWQAGSEGPATTALTNTTVDAALGVGSLANYGGSHFRDLGTLAAGDRVRFIGSAIVGCTVDFSLGVYVTENAGAAIPMSTGAGGIPAYTAPGAGRNVAVPVTFSRTVVTSGNFKIYFKGNVISAGTASLIISEHAEDIYKP